MCQTSKRNQLAQLIDWRDHAVGSMLRSLLLFVSLTVREFRSSSINHDFVLAHKVLSSKVRERRASTNVSVIQFDICQHQSVRVHLFHVISGNPWPSSSKQLVGCSGILMTYSLLFQTARTVLIQIIWASIRAQPMNSCDLLVCHRHTQIWAPLYLISDSARWCEWINMSQNLVHLFLVWIQVYSSHNFKCFGWQWAEKVQELALAISLSNHIYDHDDNRIHRLRNDIWPEGPTLGLLRNIYCKPDWCHW